MWGGGVGEPCGVFERRSGGKLLELSVLRRRGWGGYLLGGEPAGLT